MPAEPALSDRLPSVHLDLHYRRLWTVGLLAGLIRWVEILAFAVFTYEQTGSAFWVASLMMLRMLPLALFGLSLGALAARVSRRKLLMAVYTSMLAVTLGLLVLSLMGRVEVWHLAAASTLSGILWACDLPMRRGLMGDIAGPRRMAKAMSLDAVASSACRLAGPGLGGLLIARGGLVAVFLCTALLYLPGLFALAGLREPRRAPPGRSTGLGALLAGGLQAARASPQLLAALWLTIVFNVFAWPALSLVPVIGQGRLQLDPQGVGLLVSLEGVGAVLGSLLLSSGAARWRDGPVFLVTVLGFLLLQTLLAWSPQLMFTAAAMLALGAMQAGFGIMQSTLVYTAAPEARRAEAMGLMTMCIGASPLGFLVIGALAERLGAPGAILVFALCGLLAVALTWSLCRACLTEPPRTGPG